MSQEKRDRNDDLEHMGEEIEVEIIDDEAPPVVEVEASGTEGAEESGEGDEAENLRDEIEHLREMYLRKLAEFDNFRKRTEREKSELVKVGGAKIVEDLIPVLDNFERALEQSGDSSPESILQGVRMISKQLIEVLERHGLEQFDPTGQPFEPEFHEAIQRVEDSNLAPGSVAWVLAKGYTFGGRLVRPAMVGVTCEESPGEAAEDPAVEETGEDES